MLPLNVSFLRQSVLPLDKSLQFYSSLCFPWMFLAYSSSCYPWTCMFYSSLCFPSTCLFSLFNSSLYCARSCLAYSSLCLSTKSFLLHLDVSCLQKPTLHLNVSVYKQLFVAPGRVCLQEPVHVCVSVYKSFMLHFDVPVYNSLVLHLDQAHP